jgi:allantoinase
MADFDLLIRGGKIVFPCPTIKACGDRQFDQVIQDFTSGVELKDIAISEGKIAVIESGLSGSARETIDASGLHVFPGLIDSHVHFNEPGRTEWEGIETGSKALVAGGGTLFFDMPLNAHPPTVDADSFDKKLTAAEAKSVTDFAFWGGLVPENLDLLEELAERGVVGFKAFMSNSGIDDFPRADDRTLREGMKRAARLRKIVAVHAESEAITSEHAQRFTAAGKTSIRDYLDSRPERAELDAIQRALETAAETNCALHIVHVTSGAGVAVIASARDQGLDVSCETCPHYLVLTEEDMERIGPLAKCAPPLRPKNIQDGLWQWLALGGITTIGSDHSPAPQEMKIDRNFFKIWGGISSVQHTLPLLITKDSLGRHVGLAHLAKLLAANVARRFDLPEKGEIKIGFDADLALVDLEQKFDVVPNNLLYRHRHTPYLGRRLTGKVVQTILRGQTVFKDGKIVSKPLGRLVRPIQSFQ